MAKFKVGDKVRCVSYGDGTARFIGEIGEVTLVQEGHTYPYRAEFPSSRTSRFGDPRCYEHELELVEDTPVAKGYVYYTAWDNSYRKMRKDIVNWIADLRSGKRKQCQGTLHNASTGGFCCLGVYAVVAGISTPEKMGRVIDTDTDFIHEGPEAVYRKIRDELDEYVVERGISMNDSGESFSLIADMIEEFYLQQETNENV